MAKLLLICFLFVSESCLAQNGGDAELASRIDSDKTLIIFLSRTNNTKAVAELIQDKVGGDLVALELENPYPEDYKAIVKQVTEENETGFLPPLKTKVDIDTYDTIFLGFPTWGMRLPPPIKSFLHQYDFSGKTIIPFNTHAGYGVGSGFKTVKELCKGCSILEGFSIKGGIEFDGIYLAIKEERKKEVEKQLKSWLQRLLIHSG